MRNRFLPLLPSIFTYGTLVAGMAAIILAIEDQLIWAGILILIGVITDVLDGKIARVTKTSSAFGLQLDSLADTVCFGVGSTTFVYQYFRMNHLSSLLSLLVVLPIPLAGVFRLARFNLMPTKTGREDFILGLPITSAGGILALAGLSGLRHDVGLFFLPVVILLPLLLAVLMVSQIRFLTLGAVARRRKTTVAVLGVGTLLSIPFSPQLVSLTMMLSYVGLGVVRAGYGLAHR